MTVIAVVTTVASKKEAHSIALALVEARLVACGPIEKIDSVYAWRGKIEHGREYRVLLKTIAERYDAAEKAIRDLHSYELPAIHTLAFERVSQAYADWIEGEVR